MTCQSGDTARVFFQYPDFNLDSIVTKNCPVSYTLQQAPDFTGGQCLVAYDVVYRAGWADPSNCSVVNANTTTRRNVFGKIEGVGFEFRLNGIPVENSNDRINEASLYFYRNGTKELLGGISSGGTICQNRSAYVAEIISITRSDGLPDNCGDPPAKCKFTVTDTTGIIYARTEKKCPKVNIQCNKNNCPEGYERIPTIEYPGYKCREKCPPATCCECDCGDVICCYGSQGQILKTIPK